MRRLRADHTKNSALARIYLDALGKHHLIPPATEGLKLEESFICDAGDHETDLVHMSRQHNFRAVGLSDLTTGNAPQVIGEDLTKGLKIAPHHPTNRLLKT